ncbi:MAG: hypothetical protein ACRDX9_09595 [Acidimicrobiia bacterium]
MTENGPNEKTSEAGETRQRWVEEMQEALDRTGDALRGAWDATRESRMSALESAKQAATDLGAAIDKGIATAKERWSAVEAGNGEPAPSETTRAETAPDEPSSPAGDVTVTPVENE